VNARTVVAVGVASVLGCTAVAGQAAPVRQGLVSLADGDIFYEVVGAGDPIIVVHGGPGLDHNYLRPGLDVLASSHALVYYDQRGTGRSTAPLDSAHINLAAFVSDIDTLRQALGYDQVTLLGHSFGGLIAMAYAMAHPDHLKALILMDTSEPGNRFQAEEARRIQAARTPEDSMELARLEASPGYAAKDPATLSEVDRITFRSMFLDPQRVDELNLNLLPQTAHNGPVVAALLRADMANIDWWPQLPTLDVPTLVVQGRADPMPMAMAQALVAALPRAQLAVLNSGRFPEVEDPEGLVAAVSTFLAQLAR
jgi:proline iminopeptidase